MGIATTTPPLHSAVRYDTKKKKKKTLVTQGLTLKEPGDGIRPPPFDIFAISLPVVIF